MDNIKGKGNVIYFGNNWRYQISQTGVKTSM
jgi:hypothetical protein